MEDGRLASHSGFVQRRLCVGVGASFQQDCGGIEPLEFGGYVKQRAAPQGEPTRGGCAEVEFGKAPVN